uniref:Uncharacterized protein n=1 Tax=Anguilla anguilla TaxID=7936 RepID=A0A0E9UWN7_ANGAN
MGYYWKKDVQTASREAH